MPYQFFTPEQERIWSCLHRYHNSYACYSKNKDLGSKSMCPRYAFSMGTFVCKVSQILYLTTKTKGPLSIRNGFYWWFVRRKYDKQGIQFCNISVDWSCKQSCNDHVIDHVIITWLITWRSRDWSCDWSHDDHVIDHMMITWLISWWPCDCMLYTR